jgi:hypothetical protein
MSANTQPSTPSEVPPAQLSERENFYREWRAHLSARGGGGYITKEASRKLLKSLKAAMAKLPARKRNLGAITRQALDRCSDRRIDLDVLEKYDLVVRDLKYKETREEVGITSLYHACARERQKDVIMHSVAN